MTRPAAISCGLGRDWTRSWAMSRLPGNHCGCGDCRWPYRLIAGRPDIVIADIQQGIIRHLFLQKIGQILGVEGQHLDCQALDLQYFRFLFEFQR